MINRTTEEDAAKKEAYYCAHSVLLFHCLIILCSDGTVLLEGYLEPSYYYPMSVASPSASSSSENRRYNDEICLLDDFYEFHPEAFEQLTPPELDLLRRYYLLGEEVPENVFVHRAVIVKKDPQLAGAAYKVLEKALRTLGIDEIHWPSASKQE